MTDILQTLRLGLEDLWRAWNHPIAITSGGTGHVTIPKRIVEKLHEAGLEPAETLCLDKSQLEKLVKAGYFDEPSQTIISRWSPKRELEQSVKV